MNRSSFTESIVEDAALTWLKVLLDALLPKPVMGKVGVKDAILAQSRECSTEEINT